MATKVSKYFTLLFIVLIVYLSIRILEPFINAILAAIILSFLSYPIFKKLNKYIKNQNVVIILMILMTITIFIIPVVIIANVLLGDLIGFYHNIQSSGFDFSIQLPDQFSFAEEYLMDSAGTIASSLIKWLTGAIASLPEKIVSGIVMLFSMFLFLKEGPGILEKFKKIIPMEELQKDQLLDEFRNVTRGVLFGMLITMVVSGLLGGIGFWIFGIPNPALWGLVMGMISFIPLLGVTPVYIGGGIHLFMKGLYIKLGLLIVYSVFASNIDQVISSRIIGRKAKMNPFLTLVGILGGIKIFGFIGLVVGPLILSLLFVIIKFYTANFKKEFKI